MEERQDAQEAIVVVQAEHLFELLDVRADVVMGQHHALRVAGAAAGENHGGQIVQAGFSFRAQQPLQPTVRHEPRHERTRRAFQPRPGLAADFLQQNGLARQFELDLLEKHFRGDDGFDVALPDARGEGFGRHGVIQIHRHLAAAAARRN